MTMPEGSFLEAGSLVVASALQGDVQAVRLILQSLPDSHVLAVCEAAVGAMAVLLNDHVPPHAIDRAIQGARALAQAASTEGNHS